MTLKNDKKTGFARWYDRGFGRFIPEYALFSLITCFALNSLIYSGTMLLLKNVKHYDLTTSLDRSIPFIPQWILIYLVCFLFWAVNYIIIANEGKEKWFRFAAADMLSRLICGIFFVLLPTTNVRPEVTGNSICEELVRFVYWIDDPVNLFPSIHCLVSWFCYIGIRKSKKVPRWYRIFSMIFAILVCASTQFTKQHYFIDIAGGIILGELCLYISYHTDMYKKLMAVFDRLNAVVFGETENE